MLQFMGLQRVRYDCVTELTEQELVDYWIMTYCKCACKHTLTIFVAMLACYGHYYKEPLIGWLRCWKFISSQIWRLEV